MVVQVGFGEWTSAGHLRHPRYLGRRPDKDPNDVVREP
jgi:bifunctional non-homologous end joining protein LigD